MEKTVERRALVLSGGSIKGAFQAGAIAQVLESGFAPDAIYGTSVGSLNGGFLAERAGRAHKAGRTLDWPALGKELERFWLERITSSSKIAKKRSLLALFLAIVRKEFVGLVDTGPLRALVYEVLDEDNIRDSPIGFCACSVNVATGEEVYATNRYSDLLEYIIASTAIPVEMPASVIGNAAYVDGGIREVAPLRRAIHEGATEIVCVVCQPERLQGAQIDAGNFFQLVPRLMDIVITELVNNDLQRFDRVNSWVQDYEQFKPKLLTTLTQAGLEYPLVEAVGEGLHELFGSRWRYIKITVIRPANEIVLDLLKFTPAEIRDVVAYGRDVARMALEGQS